MLYSYIYIDIPVITHTHTYIYTYYTHIQYYIYLLLVVGDHVTITHCWWVILIHVSHSSGHARPGRARAAPGDSDPGSGACSAGCAPWMADGLPVPFGWQVRDIRCGSRKTLHKRLCRANLSRSVYLCRCATLTIMSILRFINSSQELPSGKLT